MNQIKRDKQGRFVKGSTFLHSLETKEKMSETHKGSKNPMWGKHHTEEWKKRISGIISKKYQNESNPAWKGNKVKYAGLHNWIRRRLGTPKFCEKCGRTDKKVYHWCSKSNKYTRNLSDWIRLCPSCHKVYDFRHNKQTFIRSCKK